MDITSYLLGKNASGGGGGGGLDWSAIGYDSTPMPIIDEYNYSKQIKDDWVPSDNLAGKFSNNTTIKIMPLVDTSQATSMASMFSYCSNLQQIPQLDTSNVTTMRQMFTGCNNLKYVPILDTSKISSTSTINQMFNSCKLLTNESVDNILQMCINATGVTDKRLILLGFSSTSYPEERIKELPHYQDFIDAGWTTGY